MHYWPILKRIVVPSTMYIRSKYTYSYSPLSLAQTEVGQLSDTARVCADGTGRAKVDLSAQGLID